MKKKIKSFINTTFKRLRFNLSANNSARFLAYYKYIYKPEKNSLNEFLDEYSRSLVGKLTVIQIGANDGITHDPIHKFIKRDAWNGVLLEPQSYVYENFLKKIYAKNPGINTLCAAIGPEDGTQRLYKIGFCTMRWATGLASFQKENVEKAFSSGMVRNQCEKYNIKIPESNELISSEDVMMICPETLLKKFGISTIDLLQIDAEGYDYEVVKIFKVDQFKPRAIIFEHTHLSEEDKISCLNHLKSHYYEVARFGPNTLAMVNPPDHLKRFFQ